MSLSIRLRNRDGTAVDPVPFVVVSAIGFTTGFSFGPPYLLALGFTLFQAIIGSAIAVITLIVLAYHRYVWAARPELRGEVPGAQRFRRLVLAVFIAVAGLGLLALPLLVR